MQKQGRQLLCCTDFSGKPMKPSPLSFVHTRYCYFLSFLDRFAGSRLRHSHLDDLSMVSDILPKIPQNLTSSNTRNVGISKSFFYRAHILWNNLPYDLRSVLSPSIFKNRLRAYLWAKIETVITSSEEDNE